MTNTVEPVEREGKARWETLLRDLPADLSGVRMLEVIHSDTKGSAGAALADRGAEEIVESNRPKDLLDTAAESFDLILCRNVLRSSAYPMALLADLWRLAAADGVLLLETDIVAGPERSQYARFVPSTRSGCGWVPGRLALRWMVEVSGFDVERWLEMPGTTGATEACLRAVRTEREPARSAPG